MPRHLKSGPVDRDYARGENGPNCEPRLEHAASRREGKAPTTVVLTTAGVGNPVIVPYQ
jgi:hypothetical protein